MSQFRILLGDVLERLRELPDESVHCVVTSPPYWGLRDYGVDGQIGLEATPGEFISKMVEVFREVRRVLRSDGTCWVNMGDCYANDGKWGGSTGGKHVKALHGDTGVGRTKTMTGLKPKDLCGMPWRLAFALQDDGWWLRQDIIWSKPNPMPESVVDRCTKAHEYIFLLSRSSRYYYDAEAIKEAAGSWNGSDFQGEKQLQTHPTTGRKPRPRAAGNKSHKTAQAYGDGLEFHRTAAGLLEAAENAYESRNKRSVWEIATEPFPEAHFATFPTKLVEPCILAGTSEKGCCSDCGKPWERLLEKEFIPQSDVSEEKGIRGAGEQKPLDASDGREGFPRGTTATKTVGWIPSCDCEELAIERGDEPRQDYLTPCTVLDPFNGSGTTGVVSLRAGRSYIGVELNPEYAEMARKRIGGDNPMFNNEIQEEKEVVCL